MSDHDVLLPDQFGGWYLESLHNKLSAPQRQGSGVALHTFLLDVNRRYSGHGELMVFVKVYSALVGIQSTMSTICAHKIR